MPTTHDVDKSLVEILLQPVKIGKERLWGLHGRKGAHYGGPVRE